MHKGVTFDAWWDGIKDTKRPAHMRDAAKMVWDAATAAERERCAKLCEQHAAYAWDHEGGALACADRIRGA